MHSYLWNTCSQILLKILRIGEMEIYFHAMTISFSLLQDWHFKQHTDKGMTSFWRSKALTKLSQYHHTIFVSRHPYHLRTKKVIYSIYGSFSLNFNWLIEGHKSCLCFKQSCFSPVRYFVSFNLFPDKKYGCVEATLIWNSFFLLSLSIWDFCYLKYTYFFSAKYLSVTSLLVLICYRNWIYFHFSVYLPARSNKRSLIEAKIMHFTPFCYIKWGGQAD